MDRIGLLLGSTLLCVVGLELGLRIALPQLEYAAESLLETDSTRIWGRRANVAYSRRHPDTGVRHAVINNNLALRQHRDIHPKKVQGEVRIGVFGDSMTENLRIPAPTVFTEVLDHLLNLHEGSFTVLNFGIDGYGTDQSYLRYRDSPVAHELDQVLYVFVPNDVMNLYENDLFELTPAGLLRQKLAPEPSAWVRFAARFYLTYALLELNQRLAMARPEAPGHDPRLSRQGRERWARRHLDATALLLLREAETGWPSELSQRYTALFRRIVGRWRYEVERHGGRFHVVSVPTRAAHLFPDDEVLELGRIEAEDPSRWRFETDNHWSELGNQLVAIHLFKYLERVLGLSPLDDRTIARQLYRYYDAFDLDWKPTRWVEEVPRDPAVAHRIRARYAALEGHP